VGITAALHGNELNGISIVHKLWENIDAKKLKGTLVLAPVLNVPGFLMGQREFTDGQDLNRIMPGKASGTTSEVYAHLIVSKIIKHFNYLIDLHTASFGRINSLYVRADMANEIVAKMAELQEPQIIVNKTGARGTLRGEATRLGIHAITVEAGDPYLFQRKHIRTSIFGLNNVLQELGMREGKEDEVEHDAIVCKGSRWMYAKNGGILRVLPRLTDSVKKEEVIATISDIFGTIIEEIRSPADAVVVAKSTNPVCEMGSRVIHLGTIWDDYEETDVEF
jgi:predicted deacylase